MMSYFISCFTARTVGVEYRTERRHTTRALQLSVRTRRYHVDCRCHRDVRNQRSLTTLGLCRSRTTTGRSVSPGVCSSTTPSVSTAPATPPTPATRRRGIYKLSSPVHTHIHTPVSGYNYDSTSIRRAFDCLSKGH